MIKKIPAITFFACAFAIIFPPWGLRGVGFERFYFLLSTRVGSSRFEYVTLDISWNYLIAELAFIMFIGLGSYFFLKLK